MLGVIEAPARCVRWIVGHGSSIMLVPEAVGDVESSPGSSAILWNLEFSCVLGWDGVFRPLLKNNWSEAKKVTGHIARTGSPEVCDAT